ncbi:MAG: thermonuclease family protein [Pseudomonadota bacterium]
MPTATSLVLDDGTVVVLQSVIAPAHTDIPRAAEPDAARRDTERDDAASKLRWPMVEAAHAQVAGLTRGRNVTVAFTRRRADRYGRRLAHVWLRKAGGSKAWLQQRLLELGLARFAPDRERTACARRLAKAETRGRAAARGLWGLSAYRVRRADRPWQLRRYRNTYQVVAGRIMSANLSRGRLYLNFGREWRRDFTAVISKKQLAYFDRSPIDPRTLAGKTVEVRGWIESRGGPLISVEHTHQLALIDSKGGLAARLRHGRRSVQRAKARDRRRSQDERRKRRSPDATPPLIPNVPPEPGALDL